MSNVVKSKRKETGFEAITNLYKLRDEITKLVLYDFGYSPEKYEKQIERYYESHKNDKNVDEIVARFRQKASSFNSWFINKECDSVMDILRKIDMSFTFGNSIYPSETAARIFEYIQRRKHISNAICYCYILKSEIHYVIRILPVDMNRYAHYSELIDKQIALLKGVRQADNRFIRPTKCNSKQQSKIQNTEKLNKITVSTQKLIDDIILVLYNFGILE